MIKPALKGRAVYSHLVHSLVQVYKSFLFLSVVERDRVCIDENINFRHPIAPLKTYDRIFEEYRK